MLSIRHVSKLAISLYVLVITIVVSAQTTCPSLVQSALELANTACTDTGRNEICYGNGLISVEAIDDIEFDEIGDIVSVSAISTMRLSEMSIDDETWGISLMRIQANLPDTIPGQNVQLVLFGDVEVANRGTITNELPATATGTVNVRLRPTTTQNNVIRSLSPNEAVVAIGRLADNSWIQLRLSNADQSVIGWVSSDFLQSDGDINTLAVVEPSEPSYGVMQAFFLQTGIGDAGCAEAPNSGVLVQTPEGAGEINLLVNEVSISLGSTILLQSQPDEFLYVSVLEGRAVITANGQSITAPAGVKVQVPLTPESAPVNPPDVIEYEEEEFISVPVQTLDEVIAVAPPSAAPIITGIDNLPGGALMADEVKRPFYINFVNPDGDEIVRVFVTCTATNAPRGCGSWVLNGGGDPPSQNGGVTMESDTVGRISYNIFCRNGSSTVYNTTFSIEIEDASGLRSNTMSLTFDCITP